MTQEWHSEDHGTVFDTVPRDGDRASGVTPSPNEKDAAIRAVQVALDRRDNGGDSR